MQLLFRPLQTRFRSGSGLPALNLAAYSNSPVRSTKSTRSYLPCTLSACKHRVSGSLSLPSRGSFHLSLTVLCAIGRHPSLALEGGPPCFPPDSSCPAVLWCRLARFRFVYGTFTLFGRPFQTSSPRFRSASCRPATPALRRKPVWAPPRSLAATWGIVFTFFSSGY